MEVLTRVKEDWLTQELHPLTEMVTVALGFLLFGWCGIYFAGFFSANAWMVASPSSVFTHHEYWRAWTTLFAHADFGHLLGNASLFLPFAYVLFGHFGFLFFPVLAIFMGGITNLIVLQTMPEQTSLVGISGVVYWMGAAYSVLYFLIETRKTWRWRFAAVLFLTVVLFIPETYRPEVSYMSHFVGYVLGALSGGLYYLFHRKKIKAAEQIEYIFDDGMFWEHDFLDTSPMTPEELRNL